MEHQIKCNVKRYHPDGNHKVVVGTLLDRFRWFGISRC